MDEADYAKDFQTRNELSSLQKTLSRPDHDPGESQVVVDGIVCCIDCGDPIPGERLDVKPDAVRCVECKDGWEKRRARRRQERRR